MRAVPVRVVAVGDGRRTPTLGRRSDRFQAAGGVIGVGVRGRAAADRLALRFDAAERVAVRDVEGVERRGAGALGGRERRELSEGARRLDGRNRFAARGERRSGDQSCGLAGAGDRVGGSGEARAREQAVAVVAVGNGGPVDRLGGDAEVVVEGARDGARDGAAPGARERERAVPGVCEQFAAGRGDRRELAVGVGRDQRRVGVAIEKFQQVVTLPGKDRRAVIRPVNSLTAARSAGRS